MIIKENHAVILQKCLMYSESYSESSLNTQICGFYVLQHLNTFENPKRNITFISSVSHCRSKVANTEHYLTF